MIVLDIFTRAVRVARDLRKFEEGLDIALIECSAGDIGKFAGDLQYACLSLIGRDMEDERGQDAFEKYATVMDRIFDINYPADKVLVDWEDWEDVLLTQATKDFIDVWIELWILCANLSEALGYKTLQKFPSLTPILKELTSLVEIFIEESDVTQLEMIFERKSLNNTLERLDQWNNYCKEKDMTGLMILCDQVDLK